MLSFTLNLFVNQWCWFSLSLFRCHGAFIDRGWSDLPSCMPCLSYFLQIQSSKGIVWESAFVYLIIGLSIENHTYWCQLLKKLHSTSLHTHWYGYLFLGKKLGGGGGLYWAPSLVCPLSCKVVSFPCLLLHSFHSYV